MSRPAHEAIRLQQHVERDPGELGGPLGTWLVHSLGWHDAVVESVSRPSSGGSANVSLLVHVVGAPDGCPDELVVRVNAPSVEVYFDTDLVRQSLVIEWVRAHSEVPVPRVIGIEHSPELLGGPFMVMERASGRAAPDYPGYNVDGFLAGASRPLRTQLWSAAIDTMGAIHRIPLDDFGPLVDAGVPGDVDSLLQHWRRSLAWMSARIDPEPYLPILDWLEEHVPVAAPVGLSWGDARVANMLFVEDRVNCVLDWEMASFGGPLVDLAWWLMFDLIQSEDLGVSRLDGLPDRAETIEQWERSTGLATTNLPWFEVLAHVELASVRAHVFAQRTAQGLPVPDARDPRAVGRLLARIDSIVHGGTGA